MKDLKELSTTELLDLLSINTEALTEKLKSRAKVTDIAPTAKNVRLIQKELDKRLDKIKSGNSGLPRNNAQ